MFFATNIANFLACRHIATLEGEGEAGEIRRKHYADPGTELLRKLGQEHEQKYLRELIDVRGRKVVEIPTDVPWREAAALTREAMAAGADAIYQATFLNGTSADSLAPRGARGGRDRRRPSEELESIMGGRVEVVSGDEPLGTQSTPGPSEEVEWGGRADFLLRVETPSKLGPWSYEVVETKLAKSTKAGALIQLCFYSDLVARIQGLEPKRMHVVLGGGAKAEEFRVQRYLAYFRKVRREFQAALAAKPITYPEPVEHCHVCSWFPNCDERRHADDHLSLVAGITSNQRKALVERDVTKLAQLATLALPVSPEVRGQRSEVRLQRSEVRRQRSEIRGQRSEVRLQRSEVRRQRSEIRGQRSEGSQRRRCCEFVNRRGCKCVGEMRSGPCMSSSNRWRQGAVWLPCLCHRREICFWTSKVIRSRSSRGWSTWWVP